MPVSAAESGLEDTVPEDTVPVKPPKRKPKCILIQTIIGYGACHLTYLEVVIAGFVACRYTKDTVPVRKIRCPKDTVPERYGACETSEKHERYGACHLSY